ncbi:hypothetical protein BC834DRAFT_361950 [Gloeopeniophorella convolvens]|nr:hypothetical protein BC834DRAFT_361950 [Gloeopeniophorella convolvens]
MSSKQSQVWLVTGASSGFGRSVAVHVLKAGGSVVAVVRKPEAVSDLTAKYSSDRLIVVKADVTNAKQVAEAFAAAEKGFGRLDVVFNNAGYSFVGETEGAPTDAARALFETNFWGAVDVSKQAVRFFRDVNPAGAGGRLIVTSSYLGIKASPALAYYCASKFALEGLTESLAAELDPKWNIKVTSIAAGAFATAIIDKLYTAPIHPAYDHDTNPVKVLRGLFNSWESKGDPDKAARAIYQLAALPEPPLHFPLGKDAVEAVRAKIAKLSQEVDQFESLSEDLLFDE